MFGSQILEVGIGLILVFLLVSLVLTAVREVIEGWMKSRSRNLERAIAELLDDQQGTGARADFYNHPLIQSLFRGQSRPTDFSNRSMFARVAKNLPSYIPREAFSLAVEDMIGEGKVSGRAKEVWDTVLSAAGGDPAAARRGLEQWFDAAMDRASGWYRRRTQTMILLLGIALALLLNVNAIAIGQYLATNEVARDQIVAVAAQVSQDRATQAATPAEGGAAAQEGADAAARLNGLTSAAGLPIGWDSFQRERIEAELRLDPVAAILSLLLGYLMVGFAATLGAPFWFDLLGKFMVIRSTVKPTEKSPDEASKDGATGGAPVSPAAGAGGGGAPPAGLVADRALETPNPVMFG